MKKVIVKKGFTLVELLAVIVILAIIAIITIPMISNVIEKSKLGAMEDSAYGLIDAANYYYAEHMNEMSSNKLFVIENGAQTSEEKLNYKGKIEGNAKVLLASNGKVALCLTSGRSYAKKGLTDSKVVMHTVSENTECDIATSENGDVVIDITGGSISDTINIKLEDMQSQIDDIKNSLNIDFSNASPDVQDINTLFQNILNEFYPDRIIDFISQKISDWNNSVDTVGIDGGTIPSNYPTAGGSVEISRDDSILNITHITSNNSVSLVDLGTSFSVFKNKIEFNNKRSLKINGTHISTQYKSTNAGVYDLPFTIDISTDNGNSWTVLYTQSVKSYNKDGAGGNEKTFSDEIDLSSYIGMACMFRVRIYNYTNIIHMLNFTKFEIS